MQIEEQAYVAELEAAGASLVHAFAVVFDGKRVRVRTAAGAAGEKSAKRKTARAGARKKKR